MAIADHAVVLTDGQSGVTFVVKKTLEGRLPALTTGKSGLLAFEIAGDTLTVLTDNLAKQYALYREHIDNIDDPDAPDAKDAFEANVTLLKGLIGFEPVEELLDAAITERDHVCIPGQDFERSGRALIDTYRYIIQELNLFFGSNILQAAIDQGTELAPEFNDLMNAVMPIYRNVDVFGAAKDAGDIHSVFGGRLLLANLVITFGGAGQTFTKLNEKLPEGADDDLSLLMFFTGTNGFPITLDITLKQADGQVAVVNIVHPGDFGVEIDLDPPNKYISVELMRHVSGGLSLDSLIVLRKRKRSLPGS